MNSVRHHRNGHAVVELAFLFPLLTLIFLMTLDIVVLALAQSQWERHAAHVARTLSLTCVEETSLPFVTLLATALPSSERRLLTVEMKKPWKSLFLKQSIELRALVKETC